MVRAKFQVIEVQDGFDSLSGQKWSETVEMTPVYSPDPNENRQFWLATPTGHVNMYITNPDAFGIFKRGQEYYLDFTLAE